MPFPMSGDIPGVGGTCDLGDTDLHINYVFLLQIYVGKSDCDMYIILLLKMQ